MSTSLKNTFEKYTFNQSGGCVLVTLAYALDCSLRKCKPETA